MKKALSAFILLMLVFVSGCSVKDYTPELPLTFTKTAVVTQGDFSFDCEICKNSERVTVTVLSTNASGMVMSYDGHNLDFVYDDFAHTINAENFEKTNIAVVVYQVFDYLENNEQIDVKKIEGGYKYEGRISTGDFILILNDDNTIDRITLKASAYSIDFDGAED